MVSIHNYEKTFERTLERIREAKDISENNKKHIIGFKNNLQSDGIGLAKVNRYLFDLFKFNKILKKPFEKANKEDLRRVVSELYNEDLSELTRRGFKIMLRKFYCYIRGIEEKGVYPDEVRWMKMTMGQKHSKLPEELLNEEDVKKIIRACTNIRDKAFIATLAESGCRISEIGTMQIKHISFESYGARLTITGKTGARKILIINSTPYLQEWLNNHPKNDNPEAFLWMHPKTGLIKYARLTEILKKSAREAGIKKRVYPHLLRHSRATQLASIMSDSQLKPNFDRYSLN
ncbi:MAG: site-specific integrase [Nanoarchaeota archaeon]